MKKLLSALLLSAIAALPAQAADKVKVGFLSTLSGPGGALGIDMRDGFQLAVKLNDGKLGGVPAEVDVVDDQQKPDIARQAIERFTKRDHVDLITGMVFSNVLLPVMPAILETNTIYLSTNTGPEDYAGEKCNPNFFAVAWQNEDIPGAMGEVMNQRLLTDVYLIAPNYPGGRETLQGFKRFYKGKIADEVYVKLGQLDFAAEIANIRAAKPQAVFFFLPGAMGINFIKQYVAAGANKEIALFTPGFSADEDTIKAVGDPMIGILNTAQWSPDFPNEANKKFVAAFQKEYGRPPTMYASQAYDTALLVDAAVKQIGGKVEDKEALRRALVDAKFDATRGKFRFNKNNFPIQDYYLREVYRDADGRITNKTIAKVFNDFQDVHAAKCKMK
ncbi:MAG: ABC transporter substrate-binding protein [Alphaproteobacteria bacterium]|nr:ABC transporter substrate-binding protein [Alphaproteobacteria bacterium]